MEYEGGDSWVSKMHRNLSRWGKALAKNRLLVGKEKSRKEGASKLREHCESDSKTIDWAVLGKQQCSSVLNRN